MKRPIFEGHFYETYYFANIIRNILHDQFAYLRNLDEFYGDDRYLAYVKPFSKYSAFHCFIEFIVSNIISEEVSEVKLDTRQDTVNRFSNFPELLRDNNPSSLPINDALNYYNVEHTSFGDWLKERGKNFSRATDDDVSDYYDDLYLEGPLEILVDKVVQEVFFILFQNRNILLLFNDMMAGQIASTDAIDVPSEYKSYLEKDGVLRRVTIPSWVKRAIFFRDRGFCTGCNRDLSGVVNISNFEHYDHIVPLVKGGLNDVSNIQLLCQDCNLKKHGRESLTSNIYEAWYPIDEENT